MCGIETWGGLSALLFSWFRFPGALPRAGMASGLWPLDSAAPKVQLIPAWANGPGAEAARLEAVRGLIPAFEAKIQRVLARVWGTAIEKSPNSQT